MPPDTNLFTDVYYLASLTYFTVYFFHQTNKIVPNYLHFTSIKSMFIVFVNKTISLLDPA